MAPSRPKFEAFAKVEPLHKTTLSITQKIHGTNAKVLIWANEAGELDLVCGSRTRWIRPEDDNYGFAAFVHSHRQAFIDLLGPGEHNGEWAGPGINSGEGLSARTFVLFSWWRWTPGCRTVSRAPEPPPLMPPGCIPVPVLYDGTASALPDEVDRAMSDLKKNGSRLVAGFMRPEGIVIQIGGRVRMKKAFDPEETMWQRGSKASPASAATDHLMQPIRLEKLLSRDERYTRDYPSSLGALARDYVEDLVEEGQLAGPSRGRAIGPVTKFIRESMASPV